MTEQQQAAMRQALEALESYHGYMEPLTTVFGGPRVPAEQSTTGKVEKAITALRQALEQQPAGEPVAWWKKHRDGSIELNEARTFIAEDALATGRRPLVFGDAHPQPAAQWVGRTQDFSQH